MQLLVLLAATICSYLLAFILAISCVGSLMEGKLLSALYAAVGVPMSLALAFVFDYVGLQLKESEEGKTK